MLEDAHAHLFSYRFFDTLRQQHPQPAASVEALSQQLGWEAPPSDNALLAEKWAAELDRHGVSKSVLMASVPGDEESIATVVRARPERFYGFFMFNPLAPDPEARARRAFDELGLQGLCLFPAMQRFSVQSDVLEPVYAAAAEKPGRVVFVHCGVLSVGVRKKLGLPSLFDIRYSNPVDLHHVALRHPRVNFVIPHFGAGYFREVLMLADLCPNVYLDTSSSNGWTKYIVPEIGLGDVFRRALDVLGPDRLLFGSDSSFFPRGWNKTVYEAQRRTLDELGVDEATERKIFGGNLARLLATAA